MMKIRHFVELNVVQEGADTLGWYVGAAPTSTSRNGIYYYLHDDGNTYDYCWDENKQSSTGWFHSRKDANAAATEYYKKYGLVYPYGTAPPPIESKLMEF